MTPIADMVEKMNQLYLISEGVGGPIKVGHSKAPRIRVCTLQTGNPRQLKLLGAWELAGEASLDAETLLLEELSRHAMAGEWLGVSEKFMADYMPDFFLSHGLEGERVI